MGRHLGGLPAQGDGQRHTEGEGDERHHQGHHVGQGEAHQIGHEEGARRHSVAHGQEHHDEAHQHGHDERNGGHPQNVEQQAVFIFDPAQPGEAVAHGLEVDVGADGEGHGEAGDEVLGELLNQWPPEDDARLPEHVAAVDVKGQEDGEHKRENGIEDNTELILAEHGESLHPFVFPAPRREAGASLRPGRKALNAW